MLLQLSYAQPNQPTTVSQVDLDQYMGKWYEIASFPNRFQRGCNCTTAKYTLDNKKVKIKNQCYKGAQFKQKIAHGVAWTTSGQSSSKLKVRFFWPFTANYWILYLTPGYQQAIVGTPDRKYLWILSRKPTIKEKLYKQLVYIAKEKGYKTSGLRLTYQSCSIKN